VRRDARAAENRGEEGEGQGGKAEELAGAQHQADRRQCKGRDQQQVKGQAERRVTVSAAKLRDGQQ
jgi:hypothetical protein